LEESERAWNDLMGQCGEQDSSKTMLLTVEEHRDRLEAWTDILAN
jgi:hypothetical protein